MILREAFMTIAESAMPANDDAALGKVAWYRPPNPQVERSLVDAIRLAGPAGLPWSRSLLFRSVHLGRSVRAERFLKALELELPEDPSSRGYLKPLVSHLSLDTGPYPLPPRLDGSQSTKSNDGITPHQIGRIAESLPRLEKLTVNTGQGGGDPWLCGKYMIDALRSFGRTVRELEMVSNGLGYENAAYIFAESLDELRALKLKNLAPGWTVIPNFAGLTQALIQERQLSEPYPSFANLETLVLWDCALDPAELRVLLESLQPAVTGNSMPASEPTLRHLTIHRLKLRQVIQGVTRTVPFPPRDLISLISPLVPYLESLHLVLFDRDPICTRARGMAAQLPPPDPPRRGDPRPGDELVQLIGPNFRRLVLGGPYCVTSDRFFSALDLAANRVSTSATTLGPGYVHQLKLTQCADEGHGEGLTPDRFVEALDREWAQHSFLREIDIAGMQIDMLVPSETEPRPLWGKAAIALVINKVKTMNEERGRLNRGRAVSPSVALHISDTIRKQAELEAEEAEWVEKRANRKRQRGAQSPQGPRASKKSGSKRAKTM